MSFRIAVQVRADAAQGDQGAKNMLLLWDRARTLKAIQRRRKEQRDKAMAAHRQMKGRAHAD